VDSFLWIAAVVAAILSSFFALTSNALRMFRRSLLEEVFAGSRGRRRLLHMETHIKELRLASSLCRSMFNLVLIVAVLGLVGAPGSSDAWGKTLLAMAIAAAVVAVFGVGVPHAWAAYAGERILYTTYPVLRGARMLLFPLVWIMHALDLPIRRLTGVSDDDEQVDFAKQEILQAATEGRAEGAVDAEEVEMIESVMEFADTHAGEIMTPRTDLVALPVSLSMSEAVERVLAAGHSRIPCYEGDLDNIVGILYAKDMLRHLVGKEEVPLRELLRKPFFVPETKALDDLLREFKERKFHIAVILDEYGGTAGIVTIEDVLEEIVGDISDEYDPSAPELMTRIDEHVADVEARIRVDELNDATALDLPENDDYDTLAGFIFSELGYIPQAGEKFESHGARFTILAASERKIDRVRVEVQAPQESSRQA
jgi:CBS domain containing-hemolysin-like protein